MSAQRIARRRISAEKQAAAANTDFANLNNNLDVNDYDTKMKSRDVKNCLDKMDGNLSPASIRRRTTRSKSVQNSDLVSHDLSMNLTRRQVRSASDAQLSLDSLQMRMGMSSATSDETFDESKEIDHHVTPDRSQLEELISPRSWSDMIASDIAISYDQTDDDRQHNSNNNNHKSDIIAKTIKLPDQLNHGNGVLKKAFVEDVTFHDVSSSQRIRSFEPKDDVITPRTWNEMVAEDSESRDHTQDSHDNGESTSEQGLHQLFVKIASSEKVNDQPDPLAASVEFKWPKELPSNGSVSRDRETQDDVRCENQRTASPETNPELRLARLKWNLRMLKRDLTAMRKTDQHIFRQLLSNYETIGQIADHVTITAETPSLCPYPVTPRSNPGSPEKTRSYSTTPGDTELLRIIREALDHPGALNIGNIVDQLSPIRRRRSSEPTTVEYEDLPQCFDEEDDQELEESARSFIIPYTFDSSRRRWRYQQTHNAHQPSLLITPSSAGSKSLEFILSSLQGTQGSFKT